MDKVLVKLYIPTIDVKYEVWLPINKTVGNIIIMLTKAVNEMNGGYYKNAQKCPLLYDKESSTRYDINLTIKEAGIRNGAEIVLI